MTTLKPATRVQIRNHYMQRDCESEITRDGHVTYRYPYRNQLDRFWRDGGYVENYHVDEQGNVHLF